jgi:hypothetical protein
MTNASDKKPLPLTLKLLGWGMGSLSVLNLIRDTTPIELYGLLKEWADAYRHLVEAIGQFLFGWINWQWIKIDASESHVVLLIIIIGTTGARAKYITEKARDGRGKILEMLLVPVLLTLLFSAILLMLPFPYGAILGLLLAVYYAIFWGFIGDKYISPGHFRSELIAVLAGFLIILLVNYGLFRPSP